MANVLIASLGESPVIITAMYDRLTKLEHMPIDKVVVLYPQGGTVPLGYDLVQEALKGECELEPGKLPFEDVNSEKDCYVFLRKLYQLLSKQQDEGNTVYLSLAGGRKSMSALMAWVVPFFSCVKKLYHLIDPDERRSMSRFLSPSKIKEEFSGEFEQKRIMRLSNEQLKRLELVDIPYSPEQQISAELRSFLLSASDADLADLEDKHPEWAEAITFTQNVAQSDKILEVMVTDHVAEKFREMCKRDEEHAQAFEICFERMRSATKLRNRVHAIGNEESEQSLPVKSSTYHFFKLRGKPERLLFYTLPKDIKNCADDQVDQVVVCELEIEQEDPYRLIKEIVSSAKFSPIPTTPIDALPSVKYRNPTKSILIVPLGTSPMVATQLYKLLTYKGQHIREVILVYPERSASVIEGAELVKKALKDEADDVLCTSVRVRGLEDINSREACERYQKVLEDEIDKVRSKNPGCTIELALSGGRKGMAALAMFVAERKKLPYVYHTLIKDERLSEIILDQTEAKVLKPTVIDKKTRNDRLFLRAYAKDEAELDAIFTVFKVPILSTVEQI
jgi:CRISPR-associated Csx14 family protein